MLAHIQVTFLLILLEDGKPTHSYDIRDEFSNIFVGTFFQKQGFSNKRFRSVFFLECTKLDFMKIQKMVFFQIFSPKIRT